MNIQLDDVIAALASPPGGAARGIIRISGTETKLVVARAFEPDDPIAWHSARRPQRHPGVVRLPGCCVPLKVDVHLWPTSRSYTGEPLAELHTVGSPPLLEAVLTALYEAGGRPARPGEFTLRAFLAGRIDLVQAEAVLGVIDAHDHLELEAALSQLAGGISGRIRAVRSDLIDLLAELEAGLDFADEEIELVTTAELAARLRRACDAVQELLDQASERMVSSGRYRVVLMGLPNAGKSTLFNALVGRDAALVSEVRGTTRDWLSAELDWNGTSVELIDTAGWEQPDDAIGREAQRLRDELIRRVDLFVWCRSAHLSGDDVYQDAQLLSALTRQERPVLLVVTKTDLLAVANQTTICGRAGLSDGDAGSVVRVSARTGAGIAELEGAATARLVSPSSVGNQMIGTSAARSRESLSSALAAVTRGQVAAESGAGDEIVAIELREALDHLGRILGTVYTDDILDRIFSKFCIGK